VKLWFGNATTEQARRLFERFFPDRPREATDFARRVGDRRVSMAALQDHLLLHRHDPDAAVARASQIAAPPAETPATRLSRPRSKTASV
jgi:hypothetical protein